VVVRVTGACIRSSVVEISDVRCCLFVERTSGTRGVAQTRGSARDDAASDDSDDTETRAKLGYVLCAVAPHCLRIIIR